MESVLASFFDIIHSKGLGLLFLNQLHSFSSNLSISSYGSGDFDILVQDSGIDVASDVLINLGLYPVERKQRASVKRKEFRGFTPEGFEFWFDIGLFLSVPVFHLFILIQQTDGFIEQSFQEESKNIYTRFFRFVIQVSVHTSLHSYIRSPGLRLHIDVDRVISDNSICWDSYEEEVVSLGLSTRSFDSFIALQRFCLHLFHNQLSIVYFPIKYPDIYSYVLYLPRTSVLLLVQNPCHIFPCFCLSFHVTNAMFHIV